MKCPVCGTEINGDLVSTLQDKRTWWLGLDGEWHSLAELRSVYMPEDTEDDGEYEPLAYKPTMGRVRK